jgi:hypothetical protein
MSLPVSMGCAKPRFDRAHLEYPAQCLHDRAGRPDENHRRDVESKCQYAVCQQNRPSKVPEGQEGFCALEEGEGNGEKDETDLQSQFGGSSWGAEQSKL